MDINCFRMFLSKVSSNTSYCPTHNRGATECSRNTPDAFQSTFDELHLYDGSDDACIKSIKLAKSKKSLRYRVLSSHIVNTQSKELLMQVPC